MRSEDSARYCEILGISPPAAAEDVKRAYRDLVLVWHPDRFAANPRLQAKAEERLRAINEAYEALRDGIDPVAPPEVPPAPPAASPADAPPVVVVRSGYPPPRRRFMARVPGPENLMTLAIVAAFCGGAFWLLDLLPLPALPFADASPPRPSAALSAAIEDWAVHARSALLPATALEPAPPPQPKVAARVRPPRPVRRAAPEPGWKGAGSIRVANQTPLDCLVMLAPENAPASAASALYVKAGASGVLNGIVPGSFIVSAQFGRDWRSPGGFAVKGPRAGPLGPFRFWQVESTQGVKGDNYEIVLRPR